MLNKSKEFLNKKSESFNQDDILELQKVVSYHNDLYYNKEAPIISDYEYDSLFKKLKILEERFWIKFRMTEEVWAVLQESSFKKVKHSRPMISLDNTYNEEDLNDFDERVAKLIGKTEESTDSISYTIEFKFDGLWVELIYKKWKLTQAITRWNGVEGEDVTENIMQIANIPKNIVYKEHLEVRGEVVMPISSFDSLNEEAKKTWTKVFSNPRNAASWSIRMKDNRVTKNRKLKFFAYDLANAKEFVEKEKKETYFDVIKDLDDLWFETSSYFEKCNWINELIHKIDNFWDIKKKIDFEIDWLVLKVNDISLWSRIGATEHHPRYAIAYKFPAEILTTKILSVEHSVWRTGVITPVANLEAIDIGGVSVKRATLHNYDEVKNLDVKIWDHIFIKRAWEVIPKIISVIKEERTWKEEAIITPTICPSCWTNVQKDEEKVRYYCPNFHTCPAQIKERLTYSVWKQGFDIDWLWKKQVELFLDKWIIHNLLDVFKIEEKQEDILNLEGFQDKSVQNLIKSVQNAKKVDIVVLITALWIFGVWKKTAKTLAKLFKSKEDIIDFSHELDELEDLPDIWPEIANNVYIYFKKQEHIDFLSRLIDILDINYYKEHIISWDSVFAWKKVCITWSFEWYKREELAEMLEKVWWDFVSSVSKNTDFLLAWEKAWSKLKKAESLWVEVLNLEKFLEILK